MKTKHLALVALGASLAFGSAVAQQPVTRKPAQVQGAGDMAKAVVIQATVAAIDPKNRIVTLKGPEGNLFAVAVGSAVKNLAKVKVGDTVDATYIQAVALDFQKGDGIRTSTSTRATDGAGGVARQVTLVSNVWAVNPGQGTVTVLGPFGQLTEVHLKDPAQLAGVKVGDQMKVTYVQAIATSILKKS